jgi:small subunit ribosomal protein S7
MKILKFNLKKREIQLNHDFYYHRWFCYHSVFFGSLIFCGKKLRAFNFFLQLKFSLKLNSDLDPYLIFLIAMLKITPKVILKSKWIGGKPKGIPFPLDEKKQVMFANKWVIKLIKDREGAVSILSLSDLLLWTLEGRGESIRKKEAVHKLAIENRYLLKKFIK